MNSRATARRIAAAAMFVALSLVSGLLPTLPGSAFKFGGFPLLLAGMLIGPRTGFAIGCLTDLMSFVLRPPGMFFPGFTLTQGLTAMIPGLLTMGKEPLTGRPLQTTHNRQAPVGLAEEAGRGGVIKAYFRILGIFGVAQLITSVLLVSYFTSQFVLGTPLQLELTTRALSQAVHVPIYALLATAILRKLADTDLYARLLTARR